MALLSDENRFFVTAKYQTNASKLFKEIPLSKSELRSVINAIDQWIDDNQASFNSALPEPAKSVLSMKEKVELFMRVVNKRWEVSQWQAVIHY
jgi:hypothetical protein